MDLVLRRERRDQGWYQRLPRRSARVSDLVFSLFLSVSGLILLAAFRSASEYLASAFQ